MQRYSFCKSFCAAFHEKLPGYTLFFFFFNKRYPVMTERMSGNGTAKAIPNFIARVSGESESVSHSELIFPDMSILSVINPTACGQTDAPRSPPIAMSAYSATPP